MSDFITGLLTGNPKARPAIFIHGGSAWTAQTNRA